MTSRLSRSSEPKRRAVVALGFALLAGGALAQGKLLDGPRAAGQVGERFDGFAMLREATSAASMAPLVEQVNAERRKVYAERATADKAPVEQIGRIYAAEIFKAAPAGTWFLTESGQWIRK